MRLPDQLRFCWYAIQLRPANGPAVVQCDETGIRQTSIAGDQVRLLWEQIAAVFAYKRDCLQTDQIRLVIGNDDPGTWIEVAEDDPGYVELVSNLPQHLSGCSPVDDWFQHVAQPPFETQWTTIYCREPHRD